MKPLAIFSLLVGAVMQGPAGGGERESDPSLTPELQLLREAFRNAESGLRSGAGTGTFQVLERAQGDSSWSTIVDADVGSYWEGAKYHVVLEYRVEPTEVKKRIIIFDESAIFAARFTDLITETAAETNVYDSTATPGGMVRPKRAGFPWDVTDFASNVVNIPQLIENVGSDGLTLTGTLEEGFHGEYHVGRSGIVRFECPAEYGYNVASKDVSVVEGGQSQTRQTFRATWRQSEDVWYIDSFSEELYLPGKVSRWELKYDTFDVNADIPDEMFTLAALEMPGGTRILDQRQNIAADDRIHFVPVDDATMEKAMDRMVDQIASMPTRERKPPRTIAVNTGPMQLLIVNVVVTAGIAVAILWNRVRRRERSASVSNPAGKA